MDGDFSAKETGFWAALASVAFCVREFFKYKQASLKQKESKMESSEQKLGIKETKDVLIAANKLTILIIKKLKDGVQIQDGIEIAESLFKDGEIKSAVGEAKDKIEQVPAEVKDIDLQEGLELGMYQASQLPLYLEAIKK